MTPSTYQPEPELRQLLTELVDGRLSPRDYERLSQLLERDEQAQAFYVEFVSLHASLQWEIARYEGEQAQPEQQHTATALDVLAHIADYERTIPVAMPRRESGVEAAREQRRRRNRQRMQQGGLAAALLVLAGFLAVMLLSSNTQIPVAVPVPVATLVESDDTMWLDKWDRLIFFHDGQRLPAQDLRLARGSAKIKFDDGAVVILDAREKLVEFELVAPNLGRLSVGRLMAKVLDPRAKGFAVLLPGLGRVVDLGTEFGLMVDEEGVSDLHVFDGLVEAQRLNAERQVVASLEVRRNAGVRLLPDGSMQSRDDSLAKAFLSEQAFDSRREKVRAARTNGVDPGPGTVQGAAHATPLHYVFPDEVGQPIPWYRRSYPDLTGRELIDGRYGLEDHMDESWVGWADGTDINSPDSRIPQPRIEFEMEPGSRYDGVEITYLISAAVAVFPPDRVRITFSNDKDFASKIDMVVGGGFQNDQARKGVYRTVVRFPASSARYVRLDFENDREWTFLSEVRFLAASGNH